MSFWGKACVAATGIAGFYAGAAKGAYNVATGKGTFGDGFDVMERVATAAEKFGDEHGAALTNAAISVAATVTNSEIKKHSRPAT